MTKWSEKQTNRRLSDCIINSLLFEDKEEREFRICKAHQQTFRWIFEQNHTTNSRSWSDMRAWLEGDQDIYWITGKPGSGKSTFVKFLSKEPRTVYHLQKWAGRTPLVIVRFYFWNSGSVAQMSQIGLLRSLLHDILQKMPQLILKAFPQRWKITKLFGYDTRAWTISELMQAFKAVLRCCECSFKLCMFVDGLDEFSGSHDELVELFKEVVSYPNVKACLSSRPWVVFEDAFSQKANLQLHDLTYPDVQRFTRASFQSNRHFLHFQARDPDRSAALIDAVATRAAGVFLWVALAVRSLLSGLSNFDRISDLQRRIDEIPPDIETFYEKMFESIEEFYFEHACQLLQIVGDAKGRLTVLELSFADEEDVDAQLNRPIGPLDWEEKDDRYQAAKRRLNSRCKGFLEIPTWITKGDLGEYQQQLATTMEGQEMEVESNAERSDDDNVDTQSTDLLPSSPADVKVSYLHRTARDFLHSPKMKQQIQRGVKETFYPYFPLFHSSLMSLKTFEGSMDQNSSPRLWERIKTGFEYAVKCESWSNMPQTRLLRELDEIVTVVSMNGTTNLSTQHGFKSEVNDNCHWTTNSRESNGSTGFADLATQYDVPLYIQQTIKTSLKDTGDGDPDIHRCLFHLVKDFRKHAGVREWVGCHVPQLSFVKFLLKRGADPNKYYNSVTAFEVALSEAVSVSQNKTIPVLEHWALLIEEFIKHDGNPKANENSAVGSLIREAFGRILPEQARHLECLTKRSARRWSAVKKYVVPPLTQVSSSMEVDPIPIPHNWVRQYPSSRLHEYLPARQNRPKPPITVFPNDTPRYYSHFWEEPPVPYPEFRYFEELRVSMPAMKPETKQIDIDYILPTADTSCNTYDIYNNPIRDSEEPHVSTPAITPETQQSVHGPRTTADTSNISNTHGTHDNSISDLASRPRRHPDSTEPSERSSEPVYTESPRSRRRPQLRHRRGIPRFQEYLENDPRER